MFRLNFLKFVIAIAFVSAFTPIAVSQDKVDRALAKAGVFENKEQLKQFFKELRSMRDPVVNTMLATVQDVAMGKKVRDSFIKKNDSLRMLNSKDVRADLEMVDSQYEELQNIAKDLHLDVADQIKKLEFKDPTETAKQLKEIHDTTQESLESVFLPHQKTRLGQIKLQVQMNRKNLYSALTTDPIVTELDLSDEQVSSIRESAKEINEELAEKIDELRRQAREKLMANLDESQKSKLQEMIGEEFRTGKTKEKDKDKTREGKGDLKSEKQLRKEQRKSEKPKKKIDNEGA